MWAYCFDSHGAKPRSVRFDEKHKTLSIGPALICMLLAEHFCWTVGKACSCLFVPCMYQVYICKWMDLQENVKNQCLHLHFPIIPNTCFERQMTVFFLQGLTVFCNVHAVCNKAVTVKNFNFSFLPSKFIRKHANYGRQIREFHRKCEKLWISVEVKTKNTFYLC